MTAVALPPQWDLTVSIWRPSATSRFLREHGSGYGETHQSRTNQHFSSLAQNWHEECKGWDVAAFKHGHHIASPVLSPCVPQTLRFSAPKTPRFQCRGGDAKIPTQSFRWSFRMISPIPFRVLFFAMTMTALTSCSNSSDDNPVTTAPVDDKKVSFVSHIKPIFQSNGCLNCHGSKGSLNLETVAGVLRGGDNGPAVVAGDADKSNLIRKISSTPPFGDRMPVNGSSVKDHDVELLRTWILQGAKDN
jgi:hypothetical protein